MARYTFYTKISFSMVCVVLGHPVQRRIEGGGGFLSHDKNLKKYNFLIKFLGIKAIKIESTIRKMFEFPKQCFGSAPDSIYTFSVIKNKFKAFWSPVETWRKFNSLRGKKLNNCNFEIYTFRISSRVKIWKFQ